MMHGSDLEEIYLHETVRSIRGVATQQGRDDVDPVWAHAPGTVGRAFASLLVDDAIRRDLAEGVSIEHWSLDALTIPKLAHWLSGELSTRDIDLGVVSSRIMNEMVWFPARIEIKALCDMAGASRMLTSILDVYVMDVVSHDEVTYADLVAIDASDIAEFTRLVHRDVS